MDLRMLQKENYEWALRNFPNFEKWEPLLGIVEEVGELSHAHLKMHEGIRGDKDTLRAKAKDAIGDIVVFLACYCSSNDFDLQSCVEETWNKVKKRDWVNDKVNGNQNLKG